MATKYRRKIGIKNFKVFQDQEEFEIAPITILTGTNSSGKSSFVKAARLLRENLVGSLLDYDKFVSMDFQMSNIHLGGFNKVLNSKTKNENTATNEISFMTNINNEIWGSLNINFNYEKDNKDRFENGVLNSIIVYSPIIEKNVLEMFKVEIDFYRTENEKDKIDFWYYSIDEELWHKQFQKVAKQHDFQFKILKLREYLWNLACKNENDFLEKMDKEHKNYYNELLSKGISPINSGLMAEIDFFQGFFGDDMQKKNFAKWTSDGKPYPWNYSAEYLNMRLNKDNVILSFPLLDRTEWKINFDEKGDFISHPLKSNDTIKLNDFNEEMYYKISQALIDKKIKNKSEIEIYLEKKEIEVLKEYYKSKRNSENYVTYVSSQDGQTAVRELENKLSEYLKFNFDLVAPVYEMPADPKEIEDFVFFDNVFSPNNSSGLKQYSFGKGLDKDNMFAKWKSFQDSFNFIIKSVNTVIKDAFKPFADFSEFTFVDTQRDLNQRVFLDRDFSEFNNSMREYLHLESYKSKNSELIKFSDREEFIKKWIKVFDISQDFLIERDKEGIGTRTYLINNEEKELLVDVGFGVNKLFSLILKIAVSPKDSTIFIEEPESNLHPAMQSQLADLFVDAHQLFGHHFVLETHSEYLIRKLQFLVASEKSSAKAEDINIYYLFHPDRVPEGRKQVEKLEIRPDGGLSADFGPGFIDEAINWKFELMRMKQSQKN